MKVLEQFLRPTQRQLFKLLCNMFEGKTQVSDKNFILVKGEAPIMLLAHLDTVHKEPVRDICKSKDRNILMSPQGIGGDDRCGVYAIVNAYELSVQKPWLLFTCDEEIGGVGADFFCHAHCNGELPEGVDKLKCMVEVDRRGSNDAVYYDCYNEEFEAYITSKGFKTAYGSFSDISVVAPELGVAAVNLSSGYYNAHTLSEFINRAELDAVMYKVVGIVSDAAKKDFPKYDYVELVSSFYDDDRLSYESSLTYRSTSNFSKLTSSKVKKIDVLKYEPIPKKLPDEYEELYWELADEYGYTVEELEYFRECYGDRVIYDLYVDEAGPFYQKTKEGAVITAIAEK